MRSGGHAWCALPLLAARRRSAFTGASLSGSVTFFLAAVHTLASAAFTLHTGVAAGHAPLAVHGSGMQLPPGVRVSHSLPAGHLSVALHSCLMHWKQPSFLPHTKPCGRWAGGARDGQDEVAGAGMDHRCSHWVG